MLVRTEYSYREVYGPIDAVVARLPAWGGVIADWGTWGHVPFAKACAKTGRKAVLGSRVSLVSSLDASAGNDVVLVPQDSAGLQNLYRAVSLAYTQYKRVPRLLRDQLPAGCTAISYGNLPGTLGLFAPGLPVTPRNAALASGDNFYPTVADRKAWLVMLGRLARTRAGPQHILSEAELRLEGATEAQLRAMQRLVETHDTPLPKAENIRFGVDDPDAELADICWKEMTRRELFAEEYPKRLEYELKLIAEKKFADYFLVLSDALRYAKQHMLVGPARGSSAGSLVCWLTRITEIDPLKHGLIFERFIDVNRMDLPDIDVDFPDVKRHMVMEYLSQKYGQHNVAHISTVIRYKPKSALTDAAKELGVPLHELDKLKDVLIERSSGDSRAGQCLEDSLMAMELGRELLKKYPAMSIAMKLEGHARQSGVHAAGIVVCNEPISSYCTVANDAVQLDKKMAEALNMLKIDALGLRTLSVVEEACALADIPMESMYSLPLDDQATFDVINNRRYASVFQFEGIALQSVAGQVQIDCFDDFAAITALARPGPLSSGESQKWMLRKSGKEEVTSVHPILDQFTHDTFGCIMYQEQVMQITRNVGQFSWADTASIRKLMSASEGNEKFARFAEQFTRGAMSNGLSKQEADTIWKAINTFGSWAFNKSHAVAYGLLSYWTAWLKAHHPLPFAVANLRHAKDDDAALSLLREILREGEVEYVPFDAELSEENWTYKDGKLLGGLLSLPGVGQKTARDIIIRRRNGIKLTKRQQTLLSGVSKFSEPFPTQKLWGHLYENPSELSASVRRIDYCEQVDIGEPDRRWVVIGRLIKKNLRDLNDEKYLARRGGKRVSDDKKDMLLFHIEDDTGRVHCMILPHLFDKYGRRIVEEAALGQWFAVKGVVAASYQLMEVKSLKWLP